MFGRVDVSKETLDRAQKPLSTRERGRLRYEKLVKAADEGVLTKATNRFEVANLAGYTEYENSSQGYSWVSNLLHRGCLIEVIDHYDEKTKKPIYNYYLGDKKPNYEPWGGKRGSGKKSKQVEKTVVREIIKEQVKENPSVQEISISTSKMSIKFSASEDKLVELAKDLMKGV